MSALSTLQPATPTLSGLPKEVRRIIWSYALSNVKSVQQVLNNSPKFERICEIASGRASKCRELFDFAPLCLVNKSILKESLQLAYIHAHFSFQLKDTEKSFGDGLTNNLRNLSVPWTACDWIGVNIPNLLDVIEPIEITAPSKNLVTTYNLPNLVHFEVLEVEDFERGYPYVELETNKTIFYLIHFKATFDTCLRIDVQDFSALVYDFGDRIEFRRMSDESEQQQYVARIRNMLCIADPTQTISIEYDQQMTLERMFPKEIRKLLGRRPTTYILPLNTMLLPDDQDSVDSTDRMESVQRTGARFPKLLRRDDIDAIRPLLNTERIAEFEAIWRNHIFPDEEMI